MDMARDIDLSKPLSAEDIAFLRTRHTGPFVDRMIALAGTEEAPEEDEGDSGEPEAEEGTEEAPEEDEGDSGESEAPEDDSEAEEDDEDSEEEDDLIGETSLYDPLQHTTQEVREHMRSSSVEERDRVKVVEQERTDREPRTSILNYNPS